VTSKYSIKDLERISGIKAHTLRIWEQRYHILRPERTTTNIRTYDDEDLKRILNISLLNNNGYKISSIAKLQEKDLLAEVNRVLNSGHKESLQVDTLILCLIYMDEERFESTLNNSVMHYGFESTIENIVFPFLRQLGNMWQIGLIAPPQEHFISNLIRQKIIVGLDKIVPQKNPSSKSFIFFLPDQELHELGLIYAHYLAKYKGHKCLYLGQSLPTSDLVTIAKSVQPDYIVTVLTAQMEEAKLETLMNTCRTELASSKILISGRLVFASDLSKYFKDKNATVFKDFSEYKSLI
jgi:DNA-binding transcriptional MerR regulator